MASSTLEASDRVKLHARVFKPADPVPPASPPRASALAPAPPPAVPPLPRPPALAGRVDGVGRAPLRVAPLQQGAGGVHGALGDEAASTGEHGRGRRRPLPKVDCARIFSIRGCNLCLNIFDSSSALRAHRTACQYSRTSVNSGFISRMSRMSLQSSTDNYGRAQGSQVVALACKMVGGGSDGSLDLCARVCLVGEDESIVFHTYIKPQIPVTNYRYETTGIRPEHLREAMPLKQAQRKIQDLLCNGEPIWKIRSKDTKARILVGHGLDHDLDCLGVEYPAFLIRYEIQNGIQDPYDDCVGAMRLYTRMRSQPHPHPHPREYSGSGEAPSSNNYPSWRQRELERMSPEALLELSGSDYYCWCLDS
uniref:Exonuclease domain-containing protein n=1 Tax=Ananas comosus var. bracteatus TaxID=296719 RepID=A0A6V7Q622_ANACO|nr:unnamed protein product [Ananas comosus var. bracteatus]